MTIERMKSEGGWICSDFVGSEYVRRRYIGYTKREARFFFKQFCRELMQSK
jgi:hypothetical protein